MEKSRGSYRDLHAARRTPPIQFTSFSRMLIRREVSSRQRVVDKHTLLHNMRVKPLPLLHHYLSPLQQF
jgi:hypothetical protein